MSLHCRRFFLFCFLLLLLFHSLNSYDPPNPLWGSSTADGPSISVPLFMLITRETQAALVGRPTPAVSLLKRFIAEDGMRDRLKGMANLMNPEDLELGATLHNILVHYNMKPVLSRPQHRFYTDGRTYFEAVIDVHQFGYLPRRALRSLQ
eukprot:m.332905 g.332905  ORF g.332905 m.332905 type:complete len:150 (+) comp55643_c0_seq7:339-788(+)